jgi:hypothetical protein
VLRRLWCFGFIAGEPTECSLSAQRDALEAHSAGPCAALAAALVAQRGLSTSLAERTLHQLLSLLLMIDECSVHCHPLKMLLALVLLVILLVLPRYSFANEGGLLW